MNFLIKRSRILFSFTILLLFLACSEEQDVLPDHSANVNQLQSDPLILDAKHWFENNNGFTQLLDTADLSDSDPIQGRNNFLTKLEKVIDWENALVIESPIQPNPLVEVPAIPINAKSELIGLTIDSNSRPSDQHSPDMVIKLRIQQVDESFNSYYLVVLQEDNKIKLDPKLSFEKLSSNLSGMTFLYSSYNSYIDGAVYENGNVIKKLPRNPNFWNPNPYQESKTRTVSNVCYQVTSWGQDCVDWYVNYAYSNTTCGDWYILDSYSTCFGPPPTGGGGSSSGGGGGWSVHSEDQFGFVGNLCGDAIRWKTVGNSYTAEVKNLGLTAIEFSKGLSINVELFNSCISIPTRMTTSYRAGDDFADAFNEAREEVGVLLNSGELSPTHFAVRKKLLELIRDNLPPGSSFTPNRGCDGSVPITEADYSC